MIYETTITILPEEENNKTVNAFVLKKKSIDARKGKIKFHLKYSVYVGENPEQEKFIPKWKTVNTNKKVVIVGSGPAGLFAALQLLEFGIKPIVIERGSRTSKRKVDIAKISTTGIVDENSNLSIDDPKYNANEAKIKEAYELAKPFYEKAKELAPDNKNIWGQMLLRIYWKLNKADYEALEKEMAY